MNLGHITAAKLMRIGISSITLLPLGADISFSRMRSYREEFVTASAGAAVNLVTAIFCMPLARSEFADLFVTSNIALAVMNLLPIKTLDGGGTLKSVLLMCLPQDTAERVSGFISVFISFRSLAFIRLFNAVIRRRILTVRALLSNFYICLYELKNVYF